jgi:diguanylate cyclase (GGDEF)-like protein
VAERLRVRIEENHLENEESQIKLSVSLGVAALIPETLSLETLIDHADQAQYQAKQSGKNLVRTWGQGSGLPGKSRTVST